MEHTDLELNTLVSNLTANLSDARNEIARLRADLDHARAVIAAVTAERDDERKRANRILGRAHTMILGLLRAEEGCVAGVVEEERDLLYRVLMEAADRAAGGKESE